MPLQKLFSQAATDKVIFLDFDGPLSTFRVFAQSDGNLDFDPVAIGILQNICEVADARIVCTSVRTFTGSSEIYKETKRLFDKFGLDLRYLHPDWTVNKPDFTNRKKNILDYLNAHPEITKYAIVDDEAVELPELVKVDGLNGIMVQDIEKICALLDIDDGDVYKLDYYRKNHPDQLFLPLDSFCESMNEHVRKRDKPSP